MSAFALSAPAFSIPLSAALRWPSSRRCAIVLFDWGRGRGDGRLGYSWWIDCETPTEELQRMRDAQSPLAHAERAEVVTQHECSHAWVQAGRTAERHSSMRSLCLLLRALGSICPLW